MTPNLRDEHTTSTHKLGEPPCSPFVTEDGASGFVCHVGSNKMRHFLWRLERLDRV